MGDHRGSEPRDRLAPPTSLAAVRDSLKLLGRRDKRLLWAAVGVQMLTSLLDMFGVVLLGVVGVFSVSAVEGQRPPQRVQDAIAAIGLGGLSDKGLVAVLVGSAAVLLLAKSVVSPILLVRVFRFLTRRAAEVSADLTRELLNEPLTFVHKRSSQQSSQSLVQGVSAAITVVLGQMVVGVSEAALLCALAVILLVANPVLAMCAIVFFAAVAVVLQRILGRQAARFGAEQADSDIATLRTIQEAIGTYREITVSNRRSFYAERAREYRRQGAGAAAGLQIVGMLPKYVSEGALVLGAFALAAILFATQSATTAAGTFALFLATATRIMPSMLRLQSAAIYLRSACGTAVYAYDLAEDLAEAGGKPEPGTVEVHPVHGVGDEHSDFAATVRLNDVSFRYPGVDAPAIAGLSLDVAEGQSVAFVGRSGAGKSTLADLILGVLIPQTGDVQVGGLAPGDAVSRWPGAIAYVPQDVMLSDASVRENVALGFPSQLIDDALVWDALKRAQLSEYLHSQPAGLDTHVGERGLRLSGGQRQRLGVARALYTRPSLLVLDEATSALDAETEQNISAMLRELENNVTTVIVAHRLSTVRHVDNVVYLDGGRIVEQGTFGDVCARVPALQRQADLMGLSASS